MNRAAWNMLGPTTHVLAGLIGLVWAVSLGWATSSLGLIVVVVIFALLPDIDSSASVIGRLTKPVSTAIEHRFGHRTLTHSLLVATAVGLLCWLWFPAPDWGIILSAWLSHLVIDMLVGERGIALFWPGEVHLRAFGVKPGSLGEALVAACCALAVLYPLYAPQQAALAAQTFANATPTPTPPPTAPPPPEAPHQTQPPREQK
jgi:inner membrane protein